VGEAVSKLNNYLLINNYCSSVQPRIAVLTLFEQYIILRHPEFISGSAITYYLGF